MPTCERSARLGKRSLSERSEQVPARAPGYKRTHLFSFLQKVLPYSVLVETLFRLIEGRAIEARLSVITEAELLVGPMMKNDEESLGLVQCRVFLIIFRV